MTTQSSSYRWFPWAITGSMAVVIVVNLVLTYFAISSAPRLVTDHPFDEGNGYNAILDAAAQQDALGWTVKLGFKPVEHARGELTAVIADRTGKPVQGYTVSAHIDRPVGAMAEIVVPLAETAPGHYAAPADLGQLGQWDVRLVARRGDALYEVTQRILVE